MDLRPRAAKERNSQLSLAFDWSEHSPTSAISSMKWPNGHYAAKNVRARARGSQLLAGRALRAAVWISAPRRGSPKDTTNPPRIPKAGDCSCWLLVSLLFVFSGMILNESLTFF